MKPFRLPIRVRRSPALRIDTTGQQVLWSPRSRREFSQVKSTSPLQCQDERSGRYSGQTCVDRDNLQRGEHSKTHRDREKANLVTASSE